MCLTLGFQDEKTDSGFFEAETRHETLNMLLFLTVGCLVDIGYINCWILLRSVVVGREGGLHFI